MGNDTPRLENRHPDSKADLCGNGISEQRTTLPNPGQFKRAQRLTRSTQTSIGLNRALKEGAPVFQTTWKSNYKNHVIELENRPWRERLLVDGKEVARQAGPACLHRTFEEIADGGKNVPVQVNTAAAAL